MKKSILLYLTIVITADLSIAQGSIDIDTNIQMGVASQEHLTITNIAFSVHDGVGQTPLIYGDFGTGNVGIGTNNPSLLSGGSSRIFEIEGLYNPGIALRNTAIGGRQYFLYSSEVEGGSLRIFDASATADRLIMDASGNIGVGMSPVSKLSVNGAITVEDEPQYGPVQFRSFGLVNYGATYGSIYIEPKPGATFYVAPYDWSTNLTSVFYGNINVNGTITQTSDRRLKKNIRKVSGSTSKLKQIRGVSFDWEETSEPAMGILAQEVESVFPELVHEVRIKKNDSGGEETFKSVDYNGLIAPMIESIKELHSIVEAQSIQIAELQNQINDSKKK